MGTTNNRLDNIDRGYPNIFAFLRNLMGIQEENYDMIRSVNNSKRLHTTTTGKTFHTLY